MRKYCTIQHPARGKIKFDLYPFQEECLDDFREHRFNIILKSRQMGISTLIAGYALWQMVFKEVNILVIANKLDSAKNMIAKVRLMNKNLPSWLTLKDIEDNKLSLKFSNESGIKATSSSPDAGRSEGVSLLIIDEAAFVDDIDAIWTAAQPTLQTGGDAIILSTPNGVGNWFHRHWQKATTGAEQVKNEKLDYDKWFKGVGENKMHPTFLHWSLHPERDQEWRDEQDTVLGEREARQECDGDFIASGDNVIDGDLVEEFKQKAVCEPLEKRGPGGELWIWEYPDYKKDYVLAADVATGADKDYSAFHVFEIESMKQVAEFKGKPDLKTYGNLCVNVANDYADALLVIERSGGYGWTPIQQALDRGYNNLYRSKKEHLYVDENQYTNKHRRREKAEQPGFNTNSKTRPLMISKLQTYMLEKTVDLNSKRLLDELSVFIWKGNRAEAQTGYNDDLVMAFCIALFIRDTALQISELNKQIQKNTLQHFNKTSYNSIYSSNDAKENPYKRNIMGEEIDLREWM